MSRYIPLASHLLGPRGFGSVLVVLEATGGACEQVSEVEIAQAKAEIGAEGIGCEPASAVTLAGLKKLVAQGFVSPDETVVLVLTGNLLKDPDYTVRYHTGELHAEFVTETRVVRASGHLAPTYANHPVPVNAARDDLMRVIRERLP